MSIGLKSNLNEHWTKVLGSGVSKATPFPFLSKTDDRRGRETTLISIHFDTKCKGGWPAKLQNIFSPTYYINILTDNLNVTVTSCGLLIKAWKLEERL
jgi:hypothetical protein